MIQLPPSSSAPPVPPYLSLASLHPSWPSSQRFRPGRTQDHPLTSSPKKLPAQVHMVSWWRRLYQGPRPVSDERNKSKSYHLASSKWQVCVKNQREERREKGAVGATKRNAMATAFTKGILGHAVAGLSNSQISGEVVLSAVLSRPAHSLPSASSGCACSPPPQDSLWQAQCYPVASYSTLVCIRRGHPHPPSWRLSSEILPVLPWVFLLPVVLPPPHSLSDVWLSSELVQLFTAPKWECSLKPLHFHTLSKGSYSYNLKCNLHTDNLKCTSSVQISSQVPDSYTQMSVWHLSQITSPQKWHWVISSLIESGLDHGVALTNRMYRSEAGAPTLALWGALSYHIRSLTTLLQRPYGMVLRLRGKRKDQPPQYPSQIQPPAIPTKAPHMWLKPSWMSQPQLPADCNYIKDPRKNSQGTIQLCLVNPQNSAGLSQ